MTYILIILLMFAGVCAWQMSRADWRRRIIPDAWLWPFMLTGLAVMAFFPWVCDIGESVVAAVFGYILAILVGWVFTKIKSDSAPIGLGDIKLIAAGGIWVGTVGLSIALIISCVAGYIWGIRKKQSHIPFAPFFFVGLIIALIVLWFLI